MDIDIVAWIDGQPVMRDELDDHEAREAILDAVEYLDIVMDW